MATTNSSTTITPLTQYHKDHVAAQLDKYLGPEYLSYRQAEGGLRVAYMEGHEVISLLNSTLGWDSWKSKLTKFEIDYKTQHPNTGRWSVGVAVTVELTLRVRDEIKGKTYETSREDVGYGTIENAPSLGKALEKCRKEAATDGLKRAARQLGNSTGNCLYNKLYLEKIKTVPGPAQRIDFDTKKLLRKAVNNKRKLRQLEDDGNESEYEDSDNLFQEIPETEEMYTI